MFRSNMQIRRNVFWSAYFFMCLEILKKKEKMIWIGEKNGA